LRRQAPEHVAEKLAVGLARRVDPLIVESRQQLAVAKLDGLLQPSVPNESLELPSVHADAVADEADRVACRHESPVARRAQRVPDRDEFGAQALARARVEHLRPEAGRDLRARVHTRMKGQPAKQRARLPAFGHRQRHAVRLKREAPEQAYAEHDDNAISDPSSRPLAPAFAFVWRSCGAPVRASRRNPQSGKRSP